MEADKPAAPDRAATHDRARTPTKPKQPRRTPNGNNESGGEFSFSLLLDHRRVAFNGTSHEEARCLSSLRSHDVDASAHSFRRRLQRSNPQTAMIGSARTV